MSKALGCENAMFPHAQRDHGTPRQLVVGFTDLVASPPALCFCRGAKLAPSFGRFLCQLQLLSFIAPLYSCLLAVAAHPEYASPTMHSHDKFRLYRDCAPRVESVDVLNLTD